MDYKPTEEFKNVIKSELEKRAEKDPEFASKFSNPKKNIDECCSYVASEAYRKNINMATPEEVFGWAVHYYDEDNVRFKKAPSCRVVVPSSTEDVIKAMSKMEQEIKAEQDAFTEKKKADLKKEAEERFIREQMEAIKPKKVKRSKEAKGTQATPIHGATLPFIEQTLF